MNQWPPGLPLWALDFSVIAEVAQSGECPSACFCIGLCSDTWPKHVSARLLTSWLQVASWCVHIHNRHRPESSDVVCVYVFMYIYIYMPFQRQKASTAQLCRNFGQEVIIFWAWYLYRSWMLPRNHRKRWMSEDDMTRHRSINVWVTSCTADTNCS